MESKWLAICMIGIMAAGMTAIGITEYARNQCKVAYSQSDKSVEEIVKICGK